MYILAQYNLITHYFSLPYVVHWLLLEILEEKSKTCLFISQCREYGRKLLTVHAKFSEVCTEKIMGQYSLLIFLNKFCYLQCTCTWMEMLTRYPATMDCYDTLNLRLQCWLISLTWCFLTYNILKEKHNSSINKISKNIDNNCEPSKIWIDQFSDTAKWPPWQPTKTAAIFF